MQTIALGPWKGVRDVGDAGQQDPAFLQDAINGYFPDPNGGAVEARPGFVTRTGSALGSGAGLVQALFSVQASNGNFGEFAIVDGIIYRRDTSAWEDVTPTSGVTISATAPVIHVVPFEGSSSTTPSLIVSDGVNKPWVTTDASVDPWVGAVININTAGSAWFARGRPTVHAGKVFFIVDDVGGTKYSTRFVWSEELTPTTGYLQDGYTNKWDFVQTSSERITQLLGSNAGLYVFRRYSIGLVSGAVNATFATTSTQDAVSQEIGTLTAPCMAKGYIWFLDADGLPHRVAVGSTTVEPIWHQMRRRINEQRADANTTTGYLIGNPYIVYSHDMNKIVMLFLRDESGNTTTSRNLYVFDADTGAYQGRWLALLATQPTDDTPTAVRIRCVGSVHSPNSLTNAVPQGFASLMIGGLNTSGTGGHVWRQTLLSQRTFGDASAAMHMSITTMLTPTDQNTEFSADLVSAEVLPDTATYSLDYYTPRRSTTALTATGVAGADSIQSSYDHGLVRWGVSPANCSGRSLRFVFHVNVPSGSTIYGFERASVRVRPFQPHHVSSA